MTYQIDQSGKIEYTSHDTVVAISNGKKFSVSLKAQEKRLLHHMYRIYFNKNRQYVYEIFSALVYKIIIDKEYPGKESLIKLHILEYDQGGQKNLSDNIDFGLVGKKSPAHNLAYTTFKKLKKPSKIVTAEQVMEIIFPTKKTGYSSINGTKDS